jgi:hypothetical protein
LPEQVRLNPIGQGIVPEVGNTKQPPGRLDYVSRQTHELRSQAQIGHREVSGRHDQGHHVLEPDILELIRLLDEPDRSSIVQRVR